jgi:riboflavin kinase / FMN adenylyltransferase
MQIFRKLQANRVGSMQYAFTFGNFDGVHLGHQFIFNKVINYAKEHNLHSAILTFHNQPLQILRPDKIPPTKLTTPEQKLKLLENFGFDVIIDIDFTPELAALSADDFLGKVTAMVPFKLFVVGEDVAFGKGREGNKEYLIKKAQEGNFQVEIVEKFAIDGVPVSSSHIRRLISNGELMQAARLLGRPYSLVGEIISGDGLGKQLGFPTLNLDVSDLTIPPQGIYGAQVLLENETKWRKASAYLGTGPTLQKRLQAVLEVHLLDFPENFSSKRIEVRFEQFLREDRLFSSKEELIAQIKKDISAIT